jgi:hypothetical protein
VYDRAPAPVLLASILVLAVLAGGIAYLVMSGRDDYPSAWDTRVEPLAEWVERERGLAFEHPVEINFLSLSEYSAVSTSEPSAEDETEMSDTTAELRALGLVSGEIDLSGSVNTLNDSGTLAFYSPATKQVYVRGETITPGMRVTLVHELVHVLQDQHFDFNRSSEMTSTRASVLRAIAEGDAGRVEDTYVSDVLTDVERRVYYAEMDSSGDTALETIREDVPDALTALFTAPYVFGEPLVTYLYDTEGVEAIDQALREPPSEEVLLNPHLWNTPEAEEVEVDVAIPSGATEVRRDQFGPIAWYLVLASRLEPQAALAAVDGLGGDAFVTYRDGQNLCVRMTVVGDDESRTAAFESALTQWVQAGPPGAGSVVRDDESRLQFQACDPGTEAGAAGSLVLEVLALPATRTAVYLEVRDSGASEGQAWCVANGMMGQLTIEQLVDPESANQSDLVAMMGNVMRACSAEG